MARQIADIGRDLPELFDRDPLAVGEPSMPRRDRAIDVREAKSVPPVAVGEVEYPVLPFGVAAGTAIPREIAPALRYLVEILEGNEWRI